MYKDKKIWLAQSDKNLFLLPNMANRHGLIAGATGTGKTITMKVMAESFSDMGVPVFMADVKGDVSGMCVPGADSADMRGRIERFGIEGFEYKSYPTRFWDIFGEQGHPVRVTISDMGPVLIARLLGLTDVQAGVLNIVFKVADEHGLLLLDMKDLRAMLQFVGDNRAEFTTQYGNVSAASIGAIQRALLAFEDEGGEIFFGEPALDIRDWMRTDVDGRGYINILSSARLIQSPKVYGTFLLWMLTELFERLPEVGDLEKPRMIFFFDEAHLLFSDAPKALVQKIVQVVKLIRSKGVGVYFISQSPSDIPDEVLAQLSNRVQHGLRAYTPAEQKAVKAAAAAFRENPKFKSEVAIMELGTGEALVSFLDEDGKPSIVENAKILPPQCLMAAASDEAKAAVVAGQSALMEKYGSAIDRESAYELILGEQQENAAAEQLAKERAELEAQKAEFAKQQAAAQAKAEKEAAKAEAAAQRAAEKEAARQQRLAEQEAARQQKEAEKAAEKAAKERQKQLDAMTRAAASVLTSAGRTAANQIIRGIFGTRR